MHILLIGAKPDDGHRLQEMLAEISSSNNKLEQVDSTNAAIEYLEKKGVDLAIIDLALSESEGDDTFDRLKESAPYLPIIVLTQPGTGTNAITAAEIEAQGYLVSHQYDAGILKRSIQHAIGRKQTELALIESEEKFRAIAASAQDGIIMMDNDGLISFWNKAAEKIFGYSSNEVLGQDLHHMLAPARYHDDTSRGIQTFKTIGTGPVLGNTIEIVGLRKDGKEFPAELSVSTLQINGMTHALGVIRDITKRKKIEDELATNEKFAAIGQLAGGIAHELRHPLGTIKNAAYFLDMALINPEPEIKEMLELLANEVTVSKRIIDSLLQFACPDGSFRKTTDLNHVLQENISGLRIPLNIDVKTHFEEDLPSVLADPDQLQQAFGNIIINAVQSMPAGGELTFRTSSKESHLVEVAISDTGTGMPDTIRKKMFDPFFSTKSKGIGLGLALTKLLIEKHGGTVTSDSKMGEGSTFTVSLPEGKSEK